MFTDWRQFHAQNTETPAVVDPRRRLRVCLFGFAAMLLVIFARAAQLEVTQGEGFRTAALRPIERETVLPASRGRILARDGTVLAADRSVSAVAVEYRWLQNPPDPQWLRAIVRTRLTKTQRKDAQRVAAEQDRVLAEREATMQRLALLCGIAPDEWAARRRKIQTRVERISEITNRRRQSAAANPAEKSDDSWAARVRRLLLEEPAPPKVIVKEELEHHVMAEDVPPATIAEIERNADLYPIAKIVTLSRRAYTQGTLAAHVLGHLGQSDEDESNRLVGRAGVERQYEGVLQGHPGVSVNQTDRRGRVLTSYCRQEPTAGRDVRLTLDAGLQRTAEELLQSALRRKRGRESLFAQSKTPDPFTGAVAVVDVRDGAILAAASMPTFDPNVFSRGDSAEIAAILADTASPLFDRVCRMAIPPGSTFKTLTAIALLESKTITPETPFSCQGYLNKPDRQRCEIFIQQGIGHGEITLADAMARSCNVYYFHFAGQMGPGPLVDWASRFGFGRPVGVDLPGEAAGTLPSPENIGRLNDRKWRTADTQSLAIGQSLLTATPLQVVCMMAAVANGGRMVVPHVAEEIANEENRLTGVRLATLQAVREGLLRVVADPRGTAHGTVYLESMSIAGKTGTAETGPDEASHAWFAGYAPAENPKVAFVVVLEHGGDAATSAGPVAKRLVLRMEQLGLLK